MVAPMIDTAWKPDGALGALYAGENAAYAEQAQQLEVIKNFLANQREQASQPFDMMGKEYDGRLAQAKMNDPNYIPWAIKGQIGQNKTQDAAGETAQVLAPFKRQQEKQQSQYDTQKLGVLRTIQDIDSKINAGGSQDEQGNLVPFSPQDKATMQQLRQRHIQQLADTPEFSQKQTLQDNNLQLQAYLGELKAQQTMKAKQDMTEKAFLNYQKAPPETRLAIAKMAIETQTNPFTKEPLTAQEMVGWQAMFKQDALTIDEKNNSRVAGKTDVDKMTKGKVPTQPRSNVGGTGTNVQTPALPSGWTLKN